MSESSKVRFTPANPGPVAQSFSRFIDRNEFVDADGNAVEITPAQAQAFFSYHKDWQAERNLPGGEAEQERQAAKIAREQKVATTSAKKVDDALALLAIALPLWLAAEAEYLATA